MPKPNKRRVDEIPLSEQMEGKGQSPSLIKPTQSQNIKVRYDQYYSVRDVVSASMRRKLAGEFPYNMLEREINVSTTSFWMELCRAVVVDMYYNEHPRKVSESELMDYLEKIGSHPAAWDKFVDEQHVREHYTEYFS